MDEELTGRVTHYFPRIGVAAVEVTSGELRVGDMIRVVGATSNFSQHVRSMQIDHVPVEAAGAGEAVAIEVHERARVNDRVFRVQAHPHVAPGRNQASTG